MRHHVNERVGVKLTIRKKVVDTSAEVLKKLVLFREWKKKYHFVRQKKTNAHARDYEKK